MSSDGNDDLAQEYPAGAIADSPVPFSQELSVNTPVTVHAPVPVIDFRHSQKPLPLCLDLCSSTCHCLVISLGRRSHVQAAPGPYSCTPHP
jgi:hypothetical protein